MDLSPDAIHWVHKLDDCETLRTKGVRSMVLATDLLATALDALANGRAEVATEYVERAMDAIAP